MHPKKVIIVGLGNQAKAWIQNLSDSGWSITCLTRNPIPQNSEILPRINHNLAIEDFKSVPQTNVEHIPIVLLTPDHTHLEVVEKLSPKTPQLDFILAHGFSHQELNSHYPNHHYHLIAPKGIASEIRNNFLKNKASIAAMNISKETTIPSDFFHTLAKDLGVKKIISASFEEETLCDLFSEQSLLCSLIPTAANHSFNYLVEKGINPELAYAECWYELKLITDTIVKMGPEKFFDLISPNALIGSRIGNEQFEKLPIKEAINSIGHDVFNKKLEFTIDEYKKTKTNIQKNWKQSLLNKIHQEFKDIY